ncbi:hypothetical protein [Bartonella sp. CB74]|uniref:hypothetical protein n=1 Tax=Bartonella sp. CB74 TaxID=3113620 RepID=UPI002F9698BB
MVFFPFSIDEIDDPERIRVVLYANGRMVHAPLNALLDQVRQDIERFSAKQIQNIMKISQRLDGVEQQLKVIFQDLETLKANKMPKINDKNSEMKNEGEKNLNKKSLKKARWEEK